MFKQKQSNAVDWSISKHAICNQSFSQEQQSLVQNCCWLKDPERFFPSGVL